MYGQDCLKCKGRLWCQLPSCPIIDSYQNLFQISHNVGEKEFTGSSPPSVFVSWNNYPKLGVAPLSPTQINPNADILDNPEKWFNLSAQELIGLRQQLVSSFTNFDAFSANNPSRYLADIQELGMAVKPVDVNIELKKKPFVEVKFDSYAPPLGPKGELKSFAIESMPKIPEKIDYIVSDTEAKTIDSLNELYKADIPVHSLYKLMSIGLLGVKKKRKLVPTRWSITATDSLLSNSMLEKIKYFSQLDEIQIFESFYLENHFFTLLIPGTWAFEQLEAWTPGSAWMQGEKNARIVSDFEFFKGRKDYAENVAGAYYSARLAVCEYLLKEKRQAVAIIFREISPSNTPPLGVWKIREAIRNGLRKKPLVFYDLDLVFQFIEKKLTIPMTQWKNQSKVLNEIKFQKKITQFI
ncbi:MAG: Nre family DNA repair protein [archaeon]|nr:Nre family DNA repair protein [archaeon]